MMSASPTLSAWQLSKSAEPAQVLGTEDWVWDHSFFHLALDGEARLDLYISRDAGVKECWQAQNNDALR